MKIRPEACLLAILMASVLSGCAKSCYRTDDTVLTQTAIGDPSDPEVSISKFPFDSKVVSSLCQITNPVRVELYIDTSGYVQGVTFLDPWPNDCAQKYVQYMKSSKLVEMPLAHPAEHFRTDLHTSRTTSRQCINLRQ